MAKLQLYINKSQRGYKNIVNINPEDDITRHIHDFRDALDALDYDHSFANTFYLLTYYAEGVALSVLRTLPDGANGDHIAASVFFPKGIVVSDSEIIKLIGDIEKIIGHDKNELSHEDIGNLREIMSPDFPVNADAPLRLPSAGHIYAYAFFGADDPALSDYVHARFYQPEFAEFAGVILIDAATKAKGKDPHNNLTHKHLEKSVVVEAPAKSPEGFVPYIFKHAFTSPMLLPAGTDIEIQWRRPGFEPVMQTVRLKAGNDNTIAAPETSEAVKTISPASFYITEQGTQRSLGTFMIKVNGIDIESSHTFTFAELRNAKVEISSPGYFAFSGNLDLASSTQALVQMKQLHCTYRFDLPLHAPDPVEAIRIYLKTKKPITECPIEGYSVAGGEIHEGAGVSNNLIYVGGHSKRLRTYGIAAAVIIFLLGFFVGWLAFDVDTKAVEAAKSAPAAAAPAPEEKAVPAAEPVPVAEAEAVAEAQPAEQMAEPVADTAAAIEYLDAGKIWRKAELEQYGTLKGLYDDLNNYNFDRINNYWAPLLADSKNFAKVLAAVKGSAEKRNPRTGKHDPTYNTADDTVINWLSYTYWIDP